MSRVEWCSCGGVISPLYDAPLYVERAVAEHVRSAQHRTWQGGARGTCPECRMVTTPGGRTCHGCRRVRELVEGAA